MSAVKRIRYQGNGNTYTAILFLLWVTSAEHNRVTLSLAPKVGKNRGHPLAVRQRVLWPFPIFTP
jgi:hypothetical protein